MRFRRLPLFLPLALALGACEQLGIEDPAKLAAVKEAEGKAIGSACRQSGRALEDCYVMNAKASKAAIFAGWREMDGYMRENNIGVIRPDLVDPPGGAAPEKTAAGEEKKPAETEKKTAEADKKTTEDKKGHAKRSAAAGQPPAGLRRMT